MFETVTRTVSNHLDFYYKLVLTEWRDLTPAKYTGLLVGVAFCGWLLMKSSTKK
jgi:hypothetical protein